MKTACVILTLALTGCAASDWDGVAEGLNRANADLEQRYRRPDPVMTDYSGSSSGSGATSAPKGKHACINGVLQPGYKGCGATPR